MPAPTPKKPSTAIPQQRKSLFSPVECLNHTSGHALHPGGVRFNAIFVDVSSHFVFFGNFFSY